MSLKTAINSTLKELRPGKILMISGTWMQKERILDIVAPITPLLEGQPPCVLHGSSYCPQGFLWHHVQHLACRGGACEEVGRMGPPSEDQKKKRVRNWSEYVAAVNPCSVSMLDNIVSVVSYHTPKKTRGSWYSGERRALWSPSRTKQTVLSFLNSKWLVYMHIVHIGSPSMPTTPWLLWAISGSISRRRGQR
jgi:hypothetical protein